MVKYFNSSIYQYLKSSLYHRPVLFFSFAIGISGKYTLLIPGPVFFLTEWLINGPRKTLLVRTSYPCKNCRLIVDPTGPKVDVPGYED